MTQNFQFKQLIKQDQALHLLVLRFFLYCSRWSDFPPGGQISDHLHCCPPSGWFSYHPRSWEIQPIVPLEWKQNTDPEISLSDSSSTDFLFGLNVTLAHASFITDFFIVPSEFFENTCLSASNILSPVNLSLRSLMLSLSFIN